VIFAAADGAALSIMLPGLGREPAACTGPVAAQVEDVIIVQGDGPGAGPDAGGRPRLLGDLTQPWCSREWPTFIPAVLDLGLRAFYAFPIQVGAIELGALDVYRLQPGSLDDAQVGDLLALAETASALLLDHGVTALGTGAAKPNPGPPSRPGAAHPVVHQATGMVGVQLGVSMAEALSRLRAYAFAHDRPLREVAHDVVTRGLRFEPEAGA
jgi:hypothetical protein